MELLSAGEISLRVEHFGKPPYAVGFFCWKVLGRGSLGNEISPTEPLPSDPQWRQTVSGKGRQVPHCLAAAMKFDTVAF